MLNDCVAAYCLTILWLHFHSSNFICICSDSTSKATSGEPWNSLFFLLVVRFNDISVVFVRWQCYLWVCSPHFCAWKDTGFEGGDEGWSFSCQVEREDSGIEVE